MNRDGRFRNHTKKGPGRFHGQGRMIVLRPLLHDIRFVMAPRQRLKPPHATLGVPTQAEHDYCVRECIASGVRKGSEFYVGVYDNAQTRLRQQLTAAQDAKLERRVVEMAGDIIR